MAGRILHGNRVLYWSGADMPPGILEGVAMDKRLVNAIAIVVTCVWAASFVADIILRDYDPSPYVHFIMMVIVGSAFGVKLLNKGGDSNGGA